MPAGAVARRAANNPPVDLDYGGRGRRRRPRTPHDSVRATTTTRAALVVVVDVLGDVRVVCGGPPPQRAPFYSRVPFRLYTGLNVSPPDAVLTVQVLVQSGMKRWTPLARRRTAMRINVSGVSVGGVE